MGFDENLLPPPDLSEAGKKAASTILKAAAAYLNKRPHTGGCKAFYSPQQWKDRGEDYGLNAELIVVHDGGDLAPFFNLDYEAVEAFEAMVDALNAVGLWAEGCTCWYTAIYKSQQEG